MIVVLLLDVEMCRPLSAGVVRGPMGFHHCQETSISWKVSARSPVRLRDVRVIRSDQACRSVG